MHRLAPYCREGPEPFALCLPECGHKEVRVLRQRARWLTRLARCSAATSSPALTDTQSRRSDGRGVTCLCQLGCCDGRCSILITLDHCRDQRTSTGPRELLTTARADSRKRVSPKMETSEACSCLVLNRA